MALRILYNSWDPAHKRPFGVLRPEQSCTISIYVPLSCRTRLVSLVVEHQDGSPYRTLSMHLERAFQDYEVHSLTFSLDNPGLYFYYFYLDTEISSFRLMKQGELTNMEAGDKWQLSCIAQDYAVPDDCRGRVLYQIFPDRFHQAGTCDCTEKLKPYWVHKDKSEPPVWEPDAQGNVLNNDFYGGNLNGIREKLPMLHELGVEILYLNPIFMAFSTHRYDTADYRRIDPMLGTEEDFAALCRDAHQLGIKIILDGVFSHTGSDSVYFNREGNFGDGGAALDPDSPYRSWYNFQHWPDQYTSWWGFDTLPCLDKASESVQDFIFGAQDNVLQKWLDLGADGFRLDVVDELPDQFLMALRRRLREMKPDALLIGEVWEDASNKVSYDIRRRYFTANQLDGVMNYPWRKAILDFVRGDDDGSALRRSVMTLAENYPAPVLDTMWNLLSSHDIPRAINALLDPADGERADLANRSFTSEQIYFGKYMLRIAAFLQFTLPGCPTIYYGDEAGMTGYRDPFNRGYYPWGKEDHELIQFYSELAHLKQDYPALRRGDLTPLKAGQNRFAFRRTYGGQSISVWVNQSGSPWDINLSGRCIFGLPNLPPHSFCAMLEET